MAAGRAKDQVEGIIDEVEAELGVPALSDQLRADLADGTGITLVEERRGFAQVAPRPEGWTMQVVTVAADRTDDRELTRDLARQAVAAVAAAGGGRLDWWVVDASAADDRAAAASGFGHGRDLLQMRRGLPAEWSADVETRSIRPGDEEAWVQVNNRAFADHPEQGGWTVETLRRRMAEDWFDPDGFRLHEIDGRLAAFCWTKLHVGEQGLPDRAGEIYVIGVDPDFQGRGLGHQLTLAGLDAISATGTAHALLYVDGANASAVGLYRKLGFHTARTDRAYVAHVDPS